MPVSLAMFGSSDGSGTLFECMAPTTGERFVWSSRMVYSALPLCAGFFFAVGDLGA
jgi:hypothetical protein